jgi:MSHA biogenesis protein MshM
MSADLYLRHFALTEPPFAITANPRFFFAGGGRGDVLRALAHALAHEQGVVLVTGEVGTGKSTLCRMLLEAPPPALSLVYLPNPSLDGAELTAALARDLGVTDLAPTPLEALQRALIERHAQGCRVAALIDEAQAMSTSALEQVRLLTNLESSASKLLVIALFGQPELAERLHEPALRALRDRISLQLVLPPFAPSDAAAYIQFRLHVAGYRGGQLFEPAAIKRLVRSCGGRSRRLNLLADRALLACFARGGRTVTWRDVGRGEGDLALPAGAFGRNFWRRMFGSRSKRLQEA